MARRAPVRFGAGRERGMILIAVLLIALGLTALTLYFADTMRLEYRGAENGVGAAQAAAAGEGARRYLLAMIRNLGDPGLMPELEDYEQEDVPVGDVGAFWLIGRDRDETKPAGEPSFGLVDEASRLNLNTATQAMLEALPEMTSDVAAAIIDWRDEDQEATQNGAESETYLMGNPAYEAKNAPFESVEELRLVRGVDLELLYGEDVNRNGVLDGNENDGDATPPADDRDGKLDPGILEYVTAWSRESNLQEDGTARVNLTSQQSRQTLQETLTTELGEQRAQAILNAAGPLQQMASVLQFYFAGGMTEDELAKVEDKLSVSDNAVIEGRVNVNTAPEEVLTCVPGIGVEFAATLVASRRGKTIDALQSLAWVAKVLGRENAIAAGPYLTTRTYVYSADVVGVGQLGRAMHRDWLVIDAAEGDPRVVYRRDLARMGWPLGATLREELRELAEER